MVAGGAAGAAVGLALLVPMEAGVPVPVPSAVVGRAGRRFGLASRLFLQLHLFLGYFLGSAARRALRAATGPALAVGALLVLGAAVLWARRRGRNEAARGWSEAACPACMALAALSERPLRAALRDG